MNEKNYLMDYKFDGAELKLGMRVDVQITNEVLENYVIIGFNEKNDEPIVDIASENDTRWGYVSQIIAIRGKLSGDEMEDWFGPRLAPLKSEEMTKLP